MQRDDDVHIWGVALEGSDEPSRRLEAALGPEERERVLGFRSWRQRREYVLAHAALRQLLGDALEVAPADVRLRELSHGKPVVDPLAHARTVSFNLTHTDDLALIAISARRRVGIDVERLRSLADCVQVAERFFATPECEALAAVPQAARPEAFLRQWTRKEAYLKALGDGFSRPLDTFAVSQGPRGHAAISWVAWDEAEPTRWSLRDLDMLPGHVACVAAEGHGWNVVWRGMLPLDAL